MEEVSERVLQLQSIILHSSSTVSIRIKHMVDMSKLDSTVKILSGKSKTLLLNITYVSHQVLQIYVIHVKGVTVFVKLLVIEGSLFIVSLYWQ